MSNPYVTVRRVQERLKVTQPGALNLLRGIEERGWLRELGPIGRVGKTAWVADEVMAILE